MVAVTPDSIDEVVNDNRAVESISTQLHDLVHAWRSGYLDDAAFENRIKECINGAMQTMGAKDVFKILKAMLEIDWDTRVELPPKSHKPVDWGD